MADFVGRIQCAIDEASGFPFLLDSSIVTPRRQLGQTFVPCIKNLCPADNKKKNLANEA